MVKIVVDYEGDLRCKAQHEPSGSVIQTDAPVDNEGKGELFSPTDLVATALGTCMLTIMGIAARKMSVDLGGATAHVEKHMTTSGVRKISKLVVRISVPAVLPAYVQEKIQSAAGQCPVLNSLSSDIEYDIKYDWAE